MKLVIEFDGIGDGEFRPTAYGVAELFEQTYGPEKWKVKVTEFTDSCTLIVELTTPPPENKILSPISISKASDFGINFFWLLEKERYGWLYRTDHLFKSPYD